MRNIIVPLKKRKKDQLCALYAQDYRVLHVIDTFHLYPDVEPGLARGHKKYLLK